MNGKTTEDLVNQEALLNALFEFTKTQGKEINKKFWELKFEQVRLSAGEPRFLIISLPIALETGYSFRLENGLAVTWNNRICIDTLHAILKNHNIPLIKAQRKKRKANVFLQI